MVSPMNLYVGEPIEKKRRVADLETSCNEAIWSKNGQKLKI